MVQRCLRARREQQRLSRSSLAIRFNFRRFFQYHVSVCSANAERADSRPTRHTVRGPIRQYCVDAKRAVSQIKVGIGLAIMQRCRKFAGLDDVRCVNQTCDACGDIQMPHVGFCRTENAELFCFSVRAKRLGQRRKLDGISERGSSSVRFDITNR